MEKIIHSAAFLKKRKFFTVLPLLVTPFITMGFWALGGGKHATKNTQASSTNGLNIQLPNASLKDEASFNKLSFYDKAEKDSVALLDAIRDDPYYRKYTEFDDDAATSETGKNRQALNTRHHDGLNVSASHDNFYEDPNETKVSRKLEELKRAISSGEKAHAQKRPGDRKYRLTPGNDAFATQVDKLEAMMRSISNESTPDAETERLNNLMDKMLDLQYPERAKQKLAATNRENEEKLLTVRSNNNAQDISLLSSAGEQKKQQPGQAFYSWSNDSSVITDASNAIGAVVHETQTLSNGGIIKLRLTGDAYIDHVKIPRGNFVYATATLNNERLKLAVNTIRCGHSIYPVKLSAYDLDGLEGIYIPGAAASELVKETSGNALQGLGMRSVDPTISEQAASAGIDAAKTIFTKRVKKIKVTVKAGYQLLLRN